MKILIIEDEPSLSETMKCFLEKEKYIVEVAMNYHDAVVKTSEYNYDCILLDIMLPDGNGLDILQMLKEQHKSENVIILSAKDALEDKVRGLELGADDYLTKPFHLIELNARIKSLLRRNIHNGENIIVAGNVKIYPDKFVVEIEGNVVEMNRKEYDILNYFISRMDYLVDKTILAEAVWGDNIDQVDNFDFIYAQVKNLRKKLKESNATLEIKSVYGFGYKMVSV